MLNVGDVVSTKVEVVAFISRNNWGSNHTIYVLSDADKNIFTIKMFAIISVGQHYHLTGTISKKKIFGKRQQMRVSNWNIEYIEE